MMRRDILMTSKEPGDIVPLVGAVINQALHDYKQSRKIKERDDAIEFLTGDYYTLFTDIPGIELMERVDGLVRYKDYLRRKEEGCSKKLKRKYVRKTPSQSKCSSN